MPSTSFQHLISIRMASVNSNNACSNKAARNSESFTISFHTKEIFDDIADELTQLYDFQPNKNNSAIFANILVQKRRVVLTLFKSQKILIQGAGCKIWIDTILSELCERQAASSAQTEDLAGNVTTLSKQPVIADYQMPQMSSISSSNSPLNLLNKLFGKSPTVNAGPANFSNGQKPIQLGQVMKPKSKRKHQCSRKL